eukprot:jgi/Chrzof1/3394/Cz12g23230.t1
MTAAKKAGATVCIDLASFELVRSCIDTLLSLLKAGLIDLVFCNEEEAVALADEMSDVMPGNDTQSPLEAVQHFVLQYASLCVISMGKQGCMARSRSGEAVKAPACGVAVVDTIGAGDCFTAGFLYAYLQGCSLQQCATVACHAGAEAVQSKGAEVSAAGWQQLRAKLPALMTQHAQGHRTG